MWPRGPGRWAGVPDPADAAGMVLGGRGEARLPGGCRLCSPLPPGPQLRAALELIRAPNI